jgi:hypothetical protein
VWNTDDDLAVAAGHRVDPERWRAHFDELMSRIAGWFRRVEPRRHARDLALGLMSDLPGKNCWTIAEHAGHATPGRQQHLLARAVWDADGVRDDLRGYVAEHQGEETFQAGKGLAGLDQHQVRRWNSWHRWTILAMLASAFLAVLAATEHARQPPPDGMIPLTSSEIHHLLNVLPGHPARSIRHRLHWSAWRRTHQPRARTSHYQKRART